MSFLVKAKSLGPLENCVSVFTAKMQSPPSNLAR